MLTIDAIDKFMNVAPMKGKTEEGSASGKIASLNCTYSDHPGLSSLCLSTCLSKASDNSHFRAQATFRVGLLLVFQKLCLEPIGLNKLKCLTS